MAIQFSSSPKPLMGAPKPAKPVSKLPVNDRANHANADMEALCEQIASLQKQIDELRALIAKTAVGDKPKKDRSEYMREYMRKKRAKDKSE